jgi:hypothetical protein
MGISAWLLAGAATAAGTAARAQTIDVYFPPGTAGYDQQLGVTVLSRLLPQYDAPGVRVGGFVVSPTLDQSVVYNSSVNGTPGSGSWASRTTGAVSAASDWSRDGLGASAGFDHYQFLALPAESYTDWNIGLTGRYTLGFGDLTGAYAHQSYHQLGTSLGSVRTEQPIANQTDTAVIGAAFTLGRITIAPDLSASAYRFGSATVGGLPVTQQYLDRDVVAGGVTARYGMDDTGGLLLVARGVDSRYPTSQPGQPSNDSDSFLLLGGIDHQASGVWRYRLLAGLEARAFQAAQYPTRVAPIIEGSVLWTPSGLTTLTGTLSRAIEDPQSAGTSGHVLTAVQLRMDHEYRRNILLALRGGVQYAQYLQGGTQTSFSLGGGITWLLNRHVRLSLDYDYSQQTSGSQATTPQNPNTQTTGAFSQGVAALTLHLAL